MALLVVHSAVLVCTAGSSPCSFIVPPPSVQGEKKPAANIGDHISGTNVPTFGACAITLATCVPALPAPWAPGSPNVILRKLPALRNIDTLSCAIGGTISVASPGQGTVHVN